MLLAFIARIALAAGLEAWPEPPVAGNAAYVAVSAAGDVWIGTDRGVWARPAGAGGWRRFGEAEGLPAGGVATALVTDGAGRVWVGTTKGGVGVAVREGRPVAVVASAGGCDVSAIVPAGPEVWLRCSDRSRARHFDGRVWDETADAPRASARAQDGAWWVAQGRTLRRRTEGGGPGDWGAPIDVGVRAEHVAVGTDGVWAAEGRGLVRLVDGAPRRIELPVHALALSARQGGGVWVGSEHGRAWVGDDAGGQVVETPVDVRFEQRLVLPGGVERWLARGVAVERTLDGAVRVVTEGPFYAVSTYVTRSAGAVTAPDGAVWAPDERGGITCYRPDGNFAGSERIPGLRRPVAPRAIVAAGRTYALVDPEESWMRLEADGIWSFLGHAPGARVVTADGAGRVWAAGGTSAWRLDGRQIVHVARLPRTHGAVGAQDGLWLLTDAGIGQLSVDGDFTLRVPAATLPERFRSLASDTSAVTDRAGRVWWGVDADGILRFDPRTGAVADLGRDRLVAKDGAGRIWTGGVSGLTDWGVAAERPVRRIGGVNVTALTFDGRNRPWVSGNGGLSRLGPDGAWERVATGSAEPSADAEGEIWWSGTRFRPDGEGAGAWHGSPACAAPVTTALAAGWLAVGDALYRLGVAPTGVVRPHPDTSVCSLLATKESLWAGLAGGVITRRSAAGWRAWTLPVSRGERGPTLGEGWDGTVWATSGREHFAFVDDAWTRLVPRERRHSDTPDMPPVLDAADRLLAATAPWADDGAGTRWVLLRGWTWRVEAGALVAVAEVDGRAIAGDPTGGVWVGVPRLARVTPDGRVTDHSEVVPGDRLEELRLADGRLWLLGRAGVVVSAPPWDRWTRDGVPYHNDRRLDPEIQVRKHDGGTDGGTWSGVPGLPSGVPASVSVADGEVFVRIDGGRYRLSAADWAKVADRYPVIEERPPASPSGPFAVEVPSVAAIPTPRRAWLRGRADATLSDRVAAFVVDGEARGQPDLPIPPLDGAASGDRWWLLLVDGTLLAGTGATGTPPETVPVHTPLAVARVGDRVCVGGETLACRADGGPWVHVPGVTGVLRLAADGDVLWAGTVSAACRVGATAACAPSEAVTDLVADGAGGAWVLTAEGARRLADGRWGPLQAGRWSSLARGPTGLVLGGASLTRLDTSGRRVDTTLPAPASDVVVTTSGDVAARVGAAIWR